MLAVDLFAHRRAHVIGVREAAAWSAGWVAVGQDTVVPRPGVIWLPQKSLIATTSTWLKDRTREDLAFQVKVTEERDYTPAADALPNHAPPHPDFPERITINGQTSDRLARKTHEFNDTRYRRIEYWLRPKPSGCGPL